MSSLKALCVCVENLIYDVAIIKCQINVKNYMGKNLKIQTMSGDLDELKNKPEKSSQREEEKEKPIAKTVDLSDVAKQKKPEKSMVESVIKSMVDNAPDKNSSKASEAADMEKKLESAEVNELQNLISKISSAVPEKRLAPRIAEKEKTFGVEELPETNIGLTKDKKIDENIDEEIRKEMEERINREMIKKAGKKDIGVIKEKAEKKTLSAAHVDTVSKEKVTVKQEKIQKDSDMKELEDLISRISKTAKKDATEKNIVEAANKISSGTKDSAVKMSVSAETREKMPLKISDKIAKNAAKEIQKNAFDSDKIESAEKKEKSFWSNISDKLKKDGSREKNNKDEIKQDKKDAENEIEKYGESGILAENKEQKSEEIKKEKSKGNLDYLSGDEYIPPENRLIRGKQKFYSSVSKRIKMREEKGELEGLKNASDIKEKQKILSRDEEYKKLKKSIIAKYHIKLFSLPWKKIIPVALAIILTITLSFYYLMSVITPEPLPQPSPAVVSGEELSEFANLEKKITISESGLRGFNNLEADAKNIFSANPNLKIIKLVIVNTEDKENRNILPLKDSLDALGITDIKNNVNNLPEKFLEMSMNKYNLFIFKTKENHIRYGIAIGLKDRYSMSEIMEKWEKERSRSKKMISVLKPLFASDRNFEDVYRIFNSANYRNIEINYVHLVDEDTALNYFIYNNNNDNGNDLLVITTSKNSAHAVADLLVDN